MSNPLVSCVMPTRARRHLALQAVRCYMAQTYQHKELLILDDKEDPSFAFEGKEFETGDIKVVVLDGRESIARKRNRLAGMARGDVIWTLDDDDWSSPLRMEQQVRRLEQSGKAVTGYKTLLFHDGAKAYRYIGPSTYALGTSLCYLRSWALEHPFPETGPIDAISKQPVCSDNGFVTAARTAAQLDTVDGLSMMVARIHRSNTSTKNLGAPNYRPIPLSELPPEFPQ